MKTVIYKSRRQWRWRMRARNGKTVGASTEAFRRLKDCRENLRLVTRAKAVYLGGVKPGVFAVTLEH